MLPRWKVVVSVYLVGVALIITGQSVYRYASQTIVELETKLQPGLPQAEYWAFEGSLNWWRQALLSTFGPISMYFLAAGIVVLVFLTAYAGLMVRRAGYNIERSGRENP